MKQARMHRSLLPHHPLAACPERLDLLSVSTCNWVYKMLAVIYCFVPVVASGDLVYPEVCPPFIRVDDSPWPVGQRGMSTLMQYNIIHALFVYATKDLPYVLLYYRQ